MPHQALDEPPVPSLDILTRNLEALARTCPELTARICDAVEGDHITLQPTASGLPTARFADHDGVFLHSREDPLAEARRVAVEIPVEIDRPILCLGLGLGYYLKALLPRCNPSRPVLAYERDPWLLRLTLSCSDFQQDILAGRLRFLLGTDIIRVPQEQQPAPLIWPHPVLKELYHQEQRLFSSPSLEDSKSRRRSLVAAGGLFVADVVDALGEHGFFSLLWDPRKVSREETLRQIKTFDPHLIFSVNPMLGLPELCEQLGIPYLIWGIDPTVECLPSRLPTFSRTWVYTYRKAHVEDFRNAGFIHVDHLPLAANPKRRFPMDLNREDREQFGGQVAFVGSSMVSQAKTLAELCQRLQPEGSASNPSEPAPAVAHNSRKLARDENGRMIDLAACLAEEEASRRRVRILADLAASGLQVSVWGDHDWQTVLPPEVKYCGPAGHFHVVNRIYNAAAINLDINRSYQQDIVTMRVFDVLSCGGFVLADYGEDLPELFKVGEEVAAYRNSAELTSLARHFLDHDADRRAMAEAGRQRVLRDHTIAGRVKQMLQNLSERAAP